MFPVPARTASWKGLSLESVLLSLLWKPGSSRTIDRARASSCRQCLMTPLPHCQLMGFGWSLAHWRCSANRLSATPIPQLTALSTIIIIIYGEAKPTLVLVATPTDWIPITVSYARAPQRYGSLEKPVGGLVSSVRPSNVNTFLAYLPNSVHWKRFDPTVRPRALRQC